MKPLPMYDVGEIKRAIGVRRLYQSRYLSTCCMHTTCTAVAVCQLMYLVSLLTHDTDRPRIREMLAKRKGILTMGYSQMGVGGGGGRGEERRKK